VKTSSSIRKLYKPIQPSIKFGNDQILYREIQACTDIENYIYCYWQLKTIAPLNESFSYRVVSDGCIDIFFELKNPSQNFIMGFCRKYTEFPIGNSFNYFGIRFLPASFPSLFQINAKELSNSSQGLNQILPHFSEWISNIPIEDDPVGKTTELLNTKFKHVILKNAHEIDSRFYESLIYIFQNKGFLDVETDLNVGISPRQLRRLFNFYVGVTPKAFCNVVRFQYILHAKPSKQSLKENKIYYDVGFYDQAHFIKNFKTFYGVNPAEAFS